jgi:hypothetical protein
MEAPSASSADVRFAFDLALEAARQLHTLAGVVEDEQTAWSTAAGKATASWEGGHRDHFTDNLATAEADAGEIKRALRTLADRFASTWAQARGEQDRINWVRWEQAQRDDDWWGEDLVDFFYEEDHGEPPPNPATPTAPDYLPTREPIHPEYENRARG